MFTHEVFNRDIIVYKYSMLTPTNYIVNTKLFQEACQTAPENWGGRTTINKPTGNFFYDPWELKDEYKGTVWQTLYDSLPVTKGEARIIVLGPGQAYQSHADIDDRYHLNILGDESFLIDLMREQMHKLNQDGIWYDMDAGFLHTAANFGRRARVQLVIRKLLKKNPYVKRKAFKNKATSVHVNRNSQFENITALRALYTAAGNPVLSVDSKKKELIGNLFRAGKVYRGF